MIDPGTISDLEQKDEEAVSRLEDAKDRIEEAHNDINRSESDLKEVIQDFTAQLKEEAENLQEGLKTGGYIREKERVSPDKVNINEGTLDGAEILRQEFEDVEDAEAALEEARGLLEQAAQEIAEVMGFIDDQRQFLENEIQQAYE